MRSDRQLLQEYARTHSGEVFQTLVERHIDLVHSIAQRVTQNAELARDVSQNVFTKLAVTPESAPANLNLLSWMHRTTRNLAIDLIRSENRRRRRERNSHEELTMNSQEENWTEIEPILEKTLMKLSTDERSLVLARYYQNRTHRSTARDLGITEDAARVRTTRALEKLRRILAKHGITTSAALLGSTLSSNAVTTAPVALSGTISSSAIATVASTASSASITTFTSLILMTKSHIAAFAAVMITAPIIISKYSKNEQLKIDLETLKSSLNEASQISPIFAKASVLKNSISKPTKPVRKPLLDQKILAKSQQYDMLMELWKKSDQGIFPVNEFSQTFEIHEDLIRFFELSPEQSTELTDLGKKTLLRIQNWEIENSKFQTTENKEHKSTYKIPPLDEQNLAIQGDFKLGVKEILGEKDYTLIQSNVESLFQSFEHSREIEFGTLSNVGEHGSPQLFRLEIRLYDDHGLRETRPSVGIIHGGELSYDFHPEARRYWHLIKPKLVE